MKSIISIIVPVHNEELYLGKCLDSILKQSFTDFEAILVNDGSTDQSGDICDDYSQKDSRIKVIHKTYGGVSSSRNAGLKAAKGEYIAFVDADDWIDNNMYKELHRLCSETGSEVSICRLGREVNGELINEERDEFIKEMDNIEALKELFKGTLYRFSLCNKLFKRSCFNNIQFPEGRIHEDLSTTYKILANSRKVIFTNYIGYIYVKRENSILTSKFNSARLDALTSWNEIIQFMEANYPQVSCEVRACLAYGLIDNINYILYQVEDKKARIKYMTVVQAFAKRNYKNIIKGQSLSLKFKCMITLLKYNLPLLIIYYSIKDIIKPRLKLYRSILSNSK